MVKSVISDSFAGKLANKRIVLYGKGPQTEKLIRYNEQLNIVGIMDRDIHEGLVMNELVPKFRESILNCTTEVVKEYLEVGIDSILQEGILKDIPIAGTLINGIKVAASIHDRRLSI